MKIFFYFGQKFYITLETCKVSKLNIWEREEDMNKHIMLYKTLVMVIFVLFIGAGFSSVIGTSFNSEEDVSSLTFYTFDRSGSRKCKVELDGGVVEDISFMFKDLKNKLTSDPSSDSTQKLKVDFVDLLDVNGLIPGGLSRDYVFSLLNPSWLKWFDGDSPFYRNDFFTFLGSRLGKIFNLESFSHTGSAAFCSIAGAGSGLQFPPIMIPRPRFVNFWSAYIDAYITAANLYTGNGFTASGPQFGLNLGFIGVGLTWAIPGEPAYFAFGGYALFALVGADEVQNYPPNREPVISEEIPVNGKRNVPLSLSELSFRISDPDGDRMDYTVTTEPDIGSDSGYNKNDGRYSVSVSGLEPDKTYEWTVEVSDAESTVKKSFNFIAEAGPPFDPFNEGWQYRKMITINHSLVAGDFSDFPVLINFIDSDLSSKAQVDGDDILFMDDVGVASKLYHEIEKWDSSTGELICWINIISISSSADTSIYLYYGNPSCASQENPGGTWNSNFKLVHHLEESDIDGGTGDIKDSTFYNNDGTTSAGMNGDDHVLAKIGYGMDFDGNGDYIDCGKDSSTAITDDFILCAWLKMDLNQKAHILGRGMGFSAPDGPNGHGYCLGTHDVNHNYAMDIYSETIRESNTVDFTDYGTFYHVAMLWNGTQTDGMDCRLCLNGTVVANSKTNFNTEMETIAWDFAIGHTANPAYAGVRQFNGIIDEVWLIDKDYGANFLLTHYNNVINAINGGFFKIGPEESNP